jgi:nucleotide-binding universal stress UspA family protein
MSESKTRTILAGVNESQHSPDAFALATALAPCLDADAIAAYVYPPGDLERPTGEGTDETALTELADSVIAALRELGSTIDAQHLTLIADRSAARGLQRAAEEGGALVISLGSTRRSTLGRVLLGSTAERLMSGSPCPVAVAPRGYGNEPRSIETIGCAFDGSPESRAALDLAATMASRNRARVRILAVHEPLASDAPAFRGVPRIAEDEAVRDHLSRLVTAAELDLRRAEIGVEANLATGNAVPILEEQTSEVDLLVMGSRGYGPARAVLLGSVSGELVRRAACPVIVIPREADGQDLVEPEVSPAPGLASE